MNKWIYIILLLLTSLHIEAEDGVFRARIYNKEYDVFMQLNLYNEDVKIPGQDILGETFGYLKKTTDSRVWIVTDVTLTNNGNTALLEMVNDYGSEDLNASLTFEPDGSYTLKQLQGSPLKIAGKGKWIKLPKTMIFKK